MVLYKKVFPLGKGLSFFEYITALRKAYFPNYVITIDNIPSTENYRAQIFYTAPLRPLGLYGSYLERILLKECTIQYSKSEGHFTLQASPTAGNLFIASFQVLSTILLFVFAIFMIATNGSISLNNIFGFAIVIIVMLAPLTLIYLRDKKLLDKIGCLGTELEKSN